MPINLDLYFAYSATCLLVVLLPGPVVALVIANSLKYGFRAGFFTVVATSLGNLILMLISATAVSTLLVLLADLFVWIRWLGAVYLIYLGVREWRRQTESNMETNVAPTHSKKRVWLEGFLIGITNPKALAFYIAFWPPFTDPTLPAVPQLAVMIVTFALIAACTDSAYALLAGQARLWMQNRRITEWRRRITATLLCGTGIGLLLARQ